MSICWNSILTFETSKWQYKEYICSKQQHTKLWSVWEEFKSSSFSRPGVWGKAVTGNNLDRNSDWQTDKRNTLDRSGNSSRRKETWVSTPRSKFINVVYLHVCTFTHSQLSSSADNATVLFFCDCKWIIIKPTWHVNNSLLSWNHLNSGTVSELLLGASESTITFRWLTGTELLWSWPRLLSICKITASWITVNVFPFSDELSEKTDNTV